jgi:hypothetical protein
MAAGGSRTDDGAPTARVVHRTARRMRLRVPSMRHDSGFFRTLEAQLRQIPKIEAVLTMPRTASVLIRFADGDGDVIAAALEALEILSLEHAGTHPERRLDAIKAAPGSANRLLDNLRGGAVDRRRLAFAVFVLLLAHRLLRGTYVAPGLALLWFIYELRHGRDQHDDRQRPNRSGG